MVQNTAEERYEGELAALRRRVAELEAAEAKRLAQAPADAATSLSNEAYRQVFSTVSQSIVIYDVDTLEIVDCNEAAVRQYGYSREEFLRLKATDVSAEPERTLAAIEGMVNENKPDVPLRYHKRKDGTVLPLEISGGVFPEGGRRLGISATRDLTERLRAEAAVRESEARLRLTQFALDNASVAAFWIAPDGRFVYANNAACRVLGYSREELLSMSVPDIDPDTPMSAWIDNWNELKRRGTMLFETRHRARDGRILSVEVATNYVRHGEQEFNFAFARDVTERKQAEEALRQAQKMESIGRLAGGIAHDFNNLLTAITGHASFAHQSLPAGDEAREDIGEVLKAAERAAGLTRQLLAFSRRQVIEPKVTDLSDLVLHTGKLLRRLIGEDIELRTVLGSDLGLVRVDPGQIEQALVNLAVNARDAMPDGGTLTLETANVVLEEGYCREHADVSPGPYVMLAVSDSGVGMGPEVMAHLFEPFFTTKEPGKGTGLGLATAYGIVKQHQGHITAESEPGRGSTFRVYLPRVAERTDRQGRGEEAERRLDGWETVLVVEDEPAVRTIAARILRERGYNVLAARGGEEALRLARDESRPLHLLLSDVVMPQMSGKDLAQRLMALQPGLKVLFVSGYTDSIIEHSGVLDEGVAFLQKPFTASALVRKVREVLDG